MEFEIVRIKWESPKLVASDTHIESSNIDQVIEANSNCMYQATGDSIIYGRNALLYIGRTNSWKTRLDSHIRSDFNRILNLYISVGRLHESIDSEKLKVIESILITYVKPSYNSSSIKDIRSDAKEKPILILNTGNRGSLPLECSNLWWINDNKTK